MTILANRKVAGDLTGKVLIAKQRHRSYDIQGSKFSSHEFSAGDIILVLMHTKKSPSAASWQNPSERVNFFMDGAAQSMPIDGAFDSNWGIVEPEDRLHGASFCFTGKITNTRDFYKQLVEMFGGEFHTSVTSKTTYLVMGDKNSKSTKADKARAAGTILLDEREFMELLRKGL